jgi:type I restriction enzyme S subunit
MIQADLPAGWQWKTIGEVCRVVPGFAFKSKDWTSEGIPVVKIKNIRSDCTVDVSEADCVPEAIVTKKLNKFRLGKSDILIAMTGATAGKVGWLSAEGSFLLNQRVAKLEPVGINKLFFWGVVSGRRYQELFFHLADGAAQPNMSGKQIEGVPIPVPPVALQETIAGMVSAYDDLIETNTRRIAILEEMARRLYEEWFVHFRFPGHETAEFDGDLPRGWVLGTLQDIVVLQRGFDLPKKARHVGAFPVYAATGKHGTHSEAKVKGPGIVTGRSGSLGKVAFVQEDFWPLNTTLWGKKFPLGSPLFAFYTLSSIDLAGFNSGAAVPTLNRNDVHELPCPLPPRDLVTSFETLVEPMLQQGRVLGQQNTNLRAQRDLLLAKLVSGEIDVMCAETMLEAAE